MSLILNQILAHGDFAAGPLATATPLRDLPGIASWLSLHPGKGELTLIFSAVALVTLAVMVWAAFLRGSHKPDLGGFSHQRTRSRSGQGKRRRRRARRGRNPTLAETGGLPPVRDSSTAEQSA